MAVDVASDGDLLLLRRVAMGDGATAEGDGFHRSDGEWCGEEPLARAQNDRMDDEAVLADQACFDQSSGEPCPALSEQISVAALLLEPLTLIEMLVWPIWSAAAREEGPAWSIAVARVLREPHIRDSPALVGRRHAPATPTNGPPLPQADGFADGPGMPTRSACARSSRKVRVAPGVVTLTSVRMRPARRTISAPMPDRQRKRLSVRSRVSALGDLRASAPRVLRSCGIVWMSISPPRRRMSESPRVATLIDAVGSMASPSKCRTRPSLFEPPDDRPPPFEFVQRSSASGAIPVAEPRVAASARCGRFRVGQ